MLEVAVIDDDEPFRIALVESIDSLGYAARGYASAEEFLPAAGENVAYCVITDIHMTGMSGFDSPAAACVRWLEGAGNDYDYSACRARAGRKRQPPVRSAYSESHSNLALSSAVSIRL